MWKDIENGALSVSDDGRVRSNLRDGRILKTQLDKKGYVRVRVTIHGVKKTFKIHRLVAELYVPNPDNMPQVNHIDGDKTNNSASNLEWVSNYDNAQHAIANDLWGNVFEASRKTNEARKTPIYSIDSETGERRDFESVSEAERFFGTRHISDVLNGKRERAKGQFFYRKEVVPDGVEHKTHN